MPIYEWQCDRGGHLFEVLAAASAANGRRRCPSCGSNSRRVFSTVAIHRGAQIMTASERASAAAVDVTDLKVPSFARPCAMDDFSASRFAAHKMGRGAEFEDKVAARALKQAARGEPSSKKTSKKSSKPPPVSSFRGS
jgi:putative FmdB family regulatory protein